jgi:hypothetical protein
MCQYIYYLFFQLGFGIIPRLPLKPLDRDQERCIPEGLKPIFWLIASGTAEAVPFKAGDNNS